ncbi:Hypothetical protein, putative [Bodo saltans]|uniref:Uncharacterized protein n=1 Tax=Bodo saltans TaxID=75058 RepID=A0A0S4J4Q6_BODSA|nr:Hypothetical protein, putative [Bodo saltans]|eukprot:CUG86451.1 Hypothetical protein, putative [Bodo saltans]
MLAGKYGVSFSVVQSRAVLVDKLLEHASGFDDAYLLTLQYLESIGTAAVYDVPTILRRFNATISRSSVVGVRGESATRVELSPPPSRVDAGREDYRRTLSTSTVAERPNLNVPSPYPHRSNTNTTDYDATHTLDDAHEHGRSVSAAAAAHLSVRPPLLEDNSLRAFHTQLITLETALFQRCLELELTSQTVAQQEATNRQDAAALQERETAVKRSEELFNQRTKSQEVELMEQTTRLRSEQQHMEETRRRLSEQQRTVDAAQRDVAERESKVAAAMQILASREAAAASQLKLTEQERTLCQKLSAEVLKRETAVRSIEKTLAAAKTELVRLEDELNSRAKQLVDDEGATRRWATELEKKELTVQSIFEQLRHKGIHVSY